MTATTWPSWSNRKIRLLRMQIQLLPESLVFIFYQHHSCLWNDSLGIATEIKLEELQAKEKEFDLFNNDWRMCVVFRVGVSTATLS